MAEATSVDTLTISVNASAQGAATGLEALTSALSALKAVLPSVTSGLSTLNAQLKTTAASSTSAASKLAASGSALKTTAAQAKNTTSAVSNAGFGMKNTATAAGRMSSSFKESTSVLKDTTTSMNAASMSTREMTSLNSLLSKNMYTLQKHLGDVGAKKTGILGLGSSFIELRSAVFTTMLLVSTLGVAFGSAVSKAMNDVEDMNRFGQIFKENAQEANTWADTLANTLGLDASALKDTYSTYYSMASAMGMVSQYADTVSKGFTQLTYDIASFKDESFDEVFTRIRSALSGETEAIDAYGYSIKQMTLQQELENEGFSQNVNQLTAADKAILIYNTLMKQSVTAQGDLARTLSSPSNMLRVLKDQATIAARSFGYLFIPAIAAVLPWLIYLTQALSRAAVALGSLFGLSVPSWSDYMASLSGVSSGLSDVTNDVADNMADSAGSAADTAESLNKAKNNVLGIDELNVMSPDTTTGGGSGGGAGSGSGSGVGGIGITPVDVYDMIGGFTGLDSLLGGVREKVSLLSTTFAPLITAAQNLWDVFKPFASLVFQGFTDFWNNVLKPLGVWTMNTVGVNVLRALTVVLQWFIDHPQAAKSLGAVLAVLTALKALDMGMGVVQWLAKVSGAILGLKNITGVTRSLAAFVATLAAIPEYTAAGATGISIFETLFPRLSVVVEGAVTAFGALTGGVTIAGVALGWWVLLILAVIAVVVLLVLNWDKVVAAVRFAAQAVGDFISRMIEGIKSVFAPWQSTFDAISRFNADTYNTICAIWEPFVSFFSDLFDTLKATTKAFWDAIYVMAAIVAAMVGTLFMNLADFLGPIFQSIGDFFRNTFGPIAQWISDNVIAPMINAFNWMVNDVLGPLFAGIADHVAGVFRDAVNNVIWFINGVIDGVNFLLDAAKSVDRTGLLAGVGYVQKIDYMAQGGMPSTGSMFIAGEAGPELYGSFRGNNNTVMPLENSGFVQAMGDAVYKATMAAQSQQQGGTKTITGDVYLDSTKVGRLLNKSDRLSGAGMSLVNAQ